MSNDISTMFTKEQNRISGRNGWVKWNKIEKNITPDRYGGYILNHRRGKGKRNGR